MKARSNTRLAVAALLIALVAMSVVLPAAAQAPRPMKFAGNNSEGRGAQVLTAEEAAQTAARTPDGRVKVVVTLATAPAVDAFVAAGGRESRASADVAAASAVDAVRAEQANFESAARSIGADVIASTQYVLNSVTVAVAPEAIASLYQFAGVVAISPVRIYEREHTTSVPLVRAPQVWDSTFAGGGFTGDGITIAVIDDGIDYTHLHFGGVGGYATNNPTTLDYPNWPPAAVPAAIGDQKVIGGTDLVGDDYDASAPAGDPTLTPTPDPDPGGCSNLDGFTGHGTHVAGSAAGWGVRPDGVGGYETNTDSYDTGVAALYPEYPAGDVTNWHIGPGVAPEAYLVSIRVFGCSGSTGTDVLLDAIEMAVATSYLGESVDVINMSLGSSYGGTSSDDPLIVAQENAADAGVSVVTSAGNSGNFTLVSGAPGSSPSSISAANITDASAISDAEVELTSGAGSPATFAAVNSAFGLQSFTNYADELIIATPANACSALTGGPYTGKTVIIDRGACEFSFKANRASEAGASGVIIVNNNAGAPISAGNGAQPATPATQAIPVVMVSQADGALLKAAAAGANTISMSSGIVGVVVDTPSRIVSSSSRGGVHRGGDDLIFKPNVAAPGDTIASAGAGTDWDMNVIGGTSMASPHVAGVVALITEQLGEATSTDRIKAVIMNTANPGVVLAGLPGTAVQPPQRVGAGQVDAYNAALAKTYAYATDAPESVTLSFGYPKVLAGSVLTVDKTITLNNPTGAAVTYNVAVVQRSDMAGTTFSVSPSSVNVPANGTATVTVTLSSNPHQAGINVATYAFDSGAGATFLTEESGLVAFTGASDGTPDLVVPVYAAPHTVADMTATGLSYQTTFDAYSIDLTGTEVDTNGADGVLTNITSVASALELVATDPDEAPVAFIPRPGDNFLQENNEGADVAAIGVTSDALSTSVNAGTVYFGVAAHGEWTSPKDVLFLFNIDTNQDGNVDFQIYNSAAVSNSFSSVFADINDFFGGGSDAAYTDWYLNDYNGSTIDTMLYKNNVVLIPFSFAFWNGYLPAGLEVDGAFDFWVETYNRDSDFELVIDTVGSASAPFTYNPFAPAYYFLDASGQSGDPAGSLYGAPLWFSQNGDGIPVDIVKSFGPGETRPDILVLHHHNELAADRYQVLDTAALEPVEEGFELLTPANNTLFVNEADLTTVTWEDRTSVTISEWRFVLTQISTNTRLGQVVDLTGLTSAADADPLTCDGTTCTLDASSLPVLEDGVYSWTATYTELSGAEIEAINAPFFFTVESNDINLLANPGFEDCNAGEPASWNGVAKCKTKPGKSNSGTGYLVSKAGQYGVQKVLATANAALDAQTTGDVLNFGGYFKGGTAAKNVFVLTIRYPGNVKDKQKIAITATTTGYALLSDSVTLTADPVWVKAKVGSAFARVLVDDVYITTVGVNGPETRGAEGLLPPPAAPDGFRGNN